MLNVPMYFVYRDGKYIDASGQSFRAYLDGKVPAYPGHRPVLRDWADHSTTAFPEVRLKKYLEMRGADSGPWNRICALPAFWVGLLYDDTALDAAWDLVKDFTLAERHALRDGTPKHALKLPFRDGTVLDLARRALEISAHAAREVPDRLGEGHLRGRRVIGEDLLPLAEAHAREQRRDEELLHGRHSWDRVLSRTNQGSGPTQKGCPTNGLVPHGLVRRARARNH